MGVSTEFPQYGDISMQKKIALTAALIMAIGLSGCASTDSVKKAQATADEAKSLAQQAASDAASAKSSAQTAASDAADAKRMSANAQNTANSAAQAAAAAQSCCDANSEKLERMFRKSMSK
jgi:membrane-bound lytic murein transglycosylase